MPLLTTKRKYMATPISQATQECTATLRLQVTFRCVMMLKCMATRAFTTKYKCPETRGSLREFTVATQLSKERMTRCQHPTLTWRKFLSKMLLSFKSVVPCNFLVVDMAFSVYANLLTHLRPAARILGSLSSLIPCSLDQ